MAYISLDAIRKFKFKEYANKGEAENNLVIATTKYIEKVVEVEGYQQLVGLKIQITDLDEPMFAIGCGAIDEDSSLWRITKSRIVAKTSDIVRAILTGNDTPYLEENDKRIQKIENLGVFHSYTDADVCESILQFYKAAKALDISLSNDMKNFVTKVLEKESRTQVENDSCDLYKKSWFGKHIAEKLAVGEYLTLSEHEISDKLKEVCAELEKKGVKQLEDITIALEGGIRKVYCIDSLGIKRVATKSEIERMVGNCYVEYANTIDLNKYYSYIVMCMLLTGEKSMIYKLENVSNMDADDTAGIKSGAHTGEINSIANKGLKLQTKNISDVLKVLDTASSVVGKNLDNYLSNYEEITEGLKKGMAELQYPDEPLNIMARAAEYTVKDMVDRVLKEKAPKKYELTAVRIAMNCREKKDYTLTEKQLRTIAGFYTRLKTQDEQGVTVDNDEAVRIATLLVNNYADKCNATVASIASKTIEHGGCSVKQFEVIKTRLGEIEREAKAKEVFGQVEASRVLPGLLNSEETKIEHTENNVPIPVFGVGSGVVNTNDINDLADELFGGDDD